MQKQYHASLRSINSSHKARNMAPSVLCEIPHKGSLYRVESEDSHEPTYVVEIRITPDEDEIDFMNDHVPTSRELRFSNYDFTVVSRLFAILDTDNINLVSRHAVKDFVYKRCPVFSKRDDDLRRLQLHSSRNDPSGSSSYELSRCSTFDEIWQSVVACSRHRSDQSGASEATCLGIEGWLVFCRFIALTQYLEAKRRFSARHSQRNSPYGNEVVMVDVPPPEPPISITPPQLVKYEDRNESSVPLPELDLDHSLLAAHDITARRPWTFRDAQAGGEVKITLFGVANDSHRSTLSSSNLEFAVTFTRRSSRFSTNFELEEGVVRRSMADMIWLNDTFTSHRVLGGTLCGRILPPFPPTISSTHGVLSSHFPSDESSFNSSSIKNSTGGAINAAAAGVGRIRDAAKSLISPLSLFMSGTSPTDIRSEESLPAAVTSHANQPNIKKNSRKKRNVSLALPENYYNPNSPVGKSRQLERYLNYLLQHPALSTSFPLNAMLTASQAGLEAARETLSDCVRVSKELQEQTPHVYDGKNTSPNFTWVRTVAQAAMALHLHGILENSGMPSASARLQHASLPAFGATTRMAGWDENEATSTDKKSHGDPSNARELLNFEDGVVNDDGFDLLPLPVPAPERRILTVGSTPIGISESSGEERFHYGSGNLEMRYPFQGENDNGSAFLGDIAIDENIDKLREVIGSVDNTFSRCLISSGEIGKANRERSNLHLNVIRGLDSWEGMRGRFIGQRSLMKGVAGVEQSKDLFEESDLALIDDLSWQTALANSAVHAAEDVRAAIRVARTASNARAAASSAALTAQSVCERSEFANIDEARAAQTRASIAQSHAIHSAVVEHEAKTVKRRATLALANDVETWNIHRKKAMLLTCISFARSQHQASRRGVDAWSTLRDGFIGAPMNPSIVERKSIPNTNAPPSHTPSTQSAISLHPGALDDSGEVTSTIFDDSPTIAAVDHNMLSFTNDHVFSTLPQVEEEDAEALSPSIVVPKKGINDSMKSTENDVQLPFAEAAPILETANDLICFDNNYIIDNEMQHHNLFGSRSSIQELRQHHHQDSSFTDETMGESMQSIVNGIINKWGLGFESDDDHLALPAGMAASILLEDDHHQLALSNPTGGSFNIV